MSGLSARPPHHDENWEEMLRRAIAMSLDEQEGSAYDTGLIVKYEYWENERVLKIRLQEG